jgi:hypothetical protein
VSRWSPALVDEVAVTGAVDTIDFKGQYGFEVKDPEALGALYDRVLTAFPDAYLEDPRDLPEIARRLGDHVERVSLRRADPQRRAPRRDAASGRVGSGAPETPPTEPTGAAQVERSVGEVGRVAATPRRRARRCARAAARCRRT